MSDYAQQGTAPGGNSAALYCRRRAWALAPKLDNVTYIPVEI